MTAEDFLEELSAVDPKMEPEKYSALMRAASLYLPSVKTEPVEVRGSAEEVPLVRSELPTSLTRQFVPPVEEPKSYEVSRLAPPELLSSNPNLRFPDGAFQDVRPTRAFNPPSFAYSAGNPVLDTPPFFPPSSPTTFPGLPTSYPVRPSSDIDLIASEIPSRLRRSLVFQKEQERVRMSPDLEIPNVDLYPTILEDLPKALAPPKPSVPSPPPPSTPPSSIPSGTKKVKPETSVAPPVSKPPKTGPASSMLRPVSTLLQKAKPTGNRVVVSIPDKAVVVYSKDGEVLRRYGVYVGTSKSPTPRGQFKIMEKLDPSFASYYGPGFMSFAEDPSSYYGFHGWVYDSQDEEEERRSPGYKTSTHGCIQMKNPDVVEFSQIVGPGDPVTIIETPIAPPPPRVRVPGLSGGRL